jgi:hypothetical protein
LRVIAPHLGGEQHGVLSYGGLFLDALKPSIQLFKVRTSENHQVVSANLAGQMDRQKRNFPFRCAGSGLLEPIPHPGRVVLPAPVLAFDAEKRMLAVFLLEVVSSGAD